MVSGACWPSRWRFACCCCRLRTSLPISLPRPMVVEATTCLLRSFGILQALHYDVDGWLQAGHWQVWGATILRWPRNVGRIHGQCMGLVLWERRHCTWERNCLEVPTDQLDALAMQSLGRKALMERRLKMAWSSFWTPWRVAWLWRHLWGCKSCFWNTFTALWSGERTLRRWRWRNTSFEEGWPFPSSKKPMQRPPWGTTSSACCCCCCCCSLVWTSKSSRAF